MCASVGSEAAVCMRVCVSVCSLCVSSGKVQSCNSSLSVAQSPQGLSHLSENSPHLSVPADFLLWCSQRAAETHTCTHSHTHTHNHDQTYIHTFVRRRHHAALGLHRRTLHISICVTKLRSYLTQKQNCVCLQMCLCCCGLVYNFKNKTTEAVS